jgi:preprotein translocase subunit SecG
LYYILMTLFIISCFVLIIFVLLQPSKSDASGVFGGGGASSTAFGPRGTQTVLAKITIAAAIIFFVIAFLFSVPGLFTKQSVGDSVAPDAPAATAPAPTTPEQPITVQPEQAPASTNATTPPPAENKDAKAGETKAGDKKATDKAKPNDKNKQ